MQEREFVALCRKAVVNYFNSQAGSTDKNGRITEDDVYVVWLCKTLQSFILLHFWPFVKAYWINKILRR